MHHRLLTWLVVLAALLDSTQLQAQQTDMSHIDSVLVAMDSVEVSLLTCSPHEEVYSLYGHSAIRVRRLNSSYDVVYNYGVFNFHAPHFVTRFVFGKTDYELGKFYTPPFFSYYRRFGSQVTAQVLSLSRIEKARLMNALEINYLPENRIYRYNIFFDNCSTRPRDIIERAVDAGVQYQPAEQTLTWRQLLHAKTSHHEWATFGNDMLLGLQADNVPTQREREFLPEWLMADFRHAVVNDGETLRPLVIQEVIEVPKGTQVVEPDFPLSPLHVALLLAALTVVMSFLQVRRAQVGLCVRIFDVSLLLAMALMGCILAVMQFSDHPFTSPNLLLIAFNPLLFLMLPFACRGGGRRYWRLVVLAALVCLCCRLVQCYPPLATTVTACLLLRAYLRAKVC